MIYYTPPQYVEVAPGPELGFSKKHTIVVGGSIGSPELVGVVLNRRGRVVCQIHLVESADGCYNITICEVSWEACP